MIDVHHHMLPPAYVEALRRTGFERRGGIRFPPWDVDDSLAVMDRHGIERAALSVSAPGTAFLRHPREAAELAGVCNDWAAGVVAHHPDRFVALATLALPDVVAARAEVARALDGLGLAGVTLLSSAGGRYPGHPSLDPLLGDLAERGAVVFLHPTVPAVVPDLDLPVFAVEFVADTTRALADLIFSGALHRHPGMRLVVAHAGGFAPYLVDRLEAAWRRDPQPQQRAPDGPTAHLRRLFYDTAASAHPATLAALDVLVGAGQVVLGTDYPFVSEEAVAAAIAGVGAHFSDPAGNRAVTGATASTLLRRR